MLYMNDGSFGRRLKGRDTVSNKNARRVFLVMEETQDEQAIPVSVHESLGGALVAAVARGAIVKQVPQADEHATEAEWYFACGRVHTVISISMTEMLP